MINLYTKLALMFVGAPLALAADPLGQRWLFYVGLTLLVLGLAVPSRAGERPGEKLRNIVGHLPGRRWFRIDRDGGDRD